MYKTDDEFEKELEELRQKIREEAIGDDESEENNAETTTEPTDSEKLMSAMKILLGEEMNCEEMIENITNAVNTSCKRFKVECDVDSLIQQEKEIKTVYPEFDIAAELKNNICFKRLIANGVNVHSALLATNNGYASAIQDIIKRDAKREMAESLRKGKEQIMPEKERKSVSPEYDARRMSDEEFEEIEKKVKQNKRVFL